MREGEEIEGVVSLWLGHADSQDALQNYVEMDYSNHVNHHLSPLAIDFGTGWYDHDFMDTAVKRPTRSLRDLLRGCSYDSIIIPKFIKLCGESLSEEANAVVLLYNFQHLGRAAPIADRSVQLHYMGSIKADMPWPN